jgi:3-hydroxybutyrate dehydrogenase
MNHSMVNKTALVTGSTSGIGLGIARAFAQAGANVMLNGFGDAGLIKELCAELSVRPDQVRYHGANVAAANEVRRLFADTEQAFGALDILVNNAGIQHVSPVDEFPEEKWTTIQNVILNIASAHGLVASPFKSAYVAAKHGQVGLTKTVALETAESGITCNAICPGYVRTPLVEKQIESQAKAHGLPHEQVIRDIILAAQPTKRFVEVEEIAALALFLCGDSARSITGAAISIDGGWTAR